MFKWLFGLVFAGMLIGCVLITAYDLGEKDGRRVALEEVAQQQMKDTLDDVLGSDKDKRLQNIIDYTTDYVLGVDFLMPKIIAKAEALEPGENKDLHELIIKSLNTAVVKMTLAKGFAEAGSLSDAERNFYEGYREALNCNKLVAKILTIVQ